MHARSRTLRSLLFSVLAAQAAACSHYVAAPARSVALAGPERIVYDTLHSAEGPSRFSQVDEHLYRGGQPSAEQLSLLYDLGVRTVISLRSEAPEERTQEEQAATKLGMRFVSIPLHGLSAPDPTRLHQIIDTVREASGAVYVHCHLGRDRTSLVVALYRVWVEGWTRDRAWQKEAVEFGHPHWLFRSLDSAYVKLTATRG